MEAPLKTHSPEEKSTQNRNTDAETQQRKEQRKASRYPDWYCPQTGIYKSSHPPRDLPSEFFFNAVSFLFSHKHLGTSALVDYSSGSSISYSELYTSVQSMASGMHRMGVRQGDVVLILLPNNIFLPVIFLGVLYLGAVVTTMNPMSSLKEVKKQAIDCNVRLAFSLGEHVDKIKCLGISTIVVPEHKNSDSKLADVSAFYNLLSSNPNLASMPSVCQRDTAAILYSSGTSGPSKGAVLTHQNFIAAIELFVRFEASQYDVLSSDNVYLAVLPMFHIYGLCLFVLGLLSLGSKVIVMRTFDADDMVRAIDKYRITHFPIVPPLLIALTRKAKSATGGSLRSLKQVSCGAAPVTKKCIEDFASALPHVDFIQGYGLTESTAVGTRGFNDKQFLNYSSVGFLAPNMEAKVVNLITGSFLPPGGMGELWLRGPGIMQEYLNSMEATMTAIKDGWLRTGDIVYFDLDGYLYIVARVKEMIKYNGFQIAPVDLEAVLLSHPDIVDAAVTA